MGNTVGVKGGGVAPPALNRFLQQASVQIFKDDVNGFSSTSDFRFMVFSVIILVITVYCSQIQSPLLGG